MRFPVVTLECQSCGRRFDGRNAFETHKDAERRCVTVNEQSERGLELRDGIWRKAEPVYRIGVQE